MLRRGASFAGRALKHRPQSVVPPLHSRSSALVLHNSMRAVLGFSTVSRRDFSSLGSPGGEDKEKNVVVNGATGDRRKKGLSTSRVVLYSELSKVRLSALVVATTLSGFMMAGPAFDWALLGYTCVGTGLCAASANTFNQVMERDFDKLMKRTERRPLPSGRITVDEAQKWAVASGVAGTGMLLSTGGWPVALLGAFNIGLYAGVYTPYKRMSEVNTWIGSVVGTIPPVIGYVAASGAGLGAMLHPESIAIGTLLFLWQFPHFFALSYMHREDYARGEFKMVAVNDPSGQRSADLVWEYSLLLSLLPGLCWMGDVTSSMFAVEGTAVNAYLLWLAYKFRQTGGQTNANARKIFLCSLWYLPVLMAALIFHNKNTSKDKHKKRDPAQWHLTAAGVDVADGESSGEAAGANDDADGGKVEAIITNTKRKLRELCVHEVAVEKFASMRGEEESANQTPLCPKVGAAAVAQKAQQGLVQASEAISVQDEKAK